jgi:hypothetical protein
MTDTIKKNIKKKLQEARRKGWWIACFHWELELLKLEVDKLEFNSEDK